MWRTGVILALIAGAGVLAYQVGARLSDEAIMTLVGVMCGILASIPISIGMLIALTRERTAYVQAEPEEDVRPEPAPVSYPMYRPSPPPAPQLPPAQTQPQIIVVAPPQTQLPQNFLPYGNYFAPQSPPALPPPAPMHERTFKIVGEQDDD